MSRLEQPKERHMRGISLLILMVQTTYVVQACAEETTQNCLNQIHKELEEREYMEQKKADTRARADSDVSDDIQRRIIEDAQQQTQLENIAVSIAAWRGMRYPGFGGGFVSRVPTLNAIEAQNSAAYIKRIYEHDADAAKDLATQRQFSLLHEGLSLGERIAFPSSSGEAKLQPNGTNLYVQNYVEPSMKWIPKIEPGS